MNKREFLSALEKALSVLQEDELRDIVSEYEQHIDIKVAKGLTEEEAIADFGSFSQLTAELLEAYHVRADYTGGDRERERKEASEGRKGAEGGGKAGLQSMAHMVREAVGRMASGVRWILRLVVRPFTWLWGKVRIWERVLREKRAVGGGRKDKAGSDSGSKERSRGVSGMEGSVFRGESRSDGRESGDKRRQAQRRKKRIEMMIHSAGKGIAGIFRWTAHMARFILQLIWNGCWLLFAVMTAGFGLLCLYGLGVLAVLLGEGYPLAGVTMGCLGLVACAFSASVIGFTFLKGRGEEAWRNRKIKASGRNGRTGNQRLKPEENGSEGLEKNAREPGGSVGRVQESGAGFGEEDGRADTEEGRQDMAATLDGGGEQSWANCGA